MRDFSTTLGEAVGVWFAHNNERHHRVEAERIGGDPET
jgi:hypothetical protein